MKNRRLIPALAVFCILLQLPAKAQFRTKAQQLVLTSEDSLQQGLDESRTVISGYGSAYFQRDFNAQKNIASLERAVLFVGHQFNNKFAFFSEMEIENAKVVGGEGSGEISMEQAYIRYNINSRQYLVAGLFIPRIGILNENHLPVNFNGVERTQVETYIIPATWRELGIGWYGTFDKLQLSAGLMNGLDNANMTHGTGLQGGRAEGFLAATNNIAVTAAAVYSLGPVRTQISGYMGGTTGLTPRSADSLNLDGGAFGTPVYLGEADVQYARNGLSARALGVVVSFPDAARVNTAYAKNLATEMVGAYAEVAYDILHRHTKKVDGTAQLNLFARYEYLDMNAAIPAPPKAIYDGTLAQSNLIAGINYMPIPNIALKADVRLLHTGEQNKDLIINPPPNALPYRQNNTFLNVGIGYSF